MNEFIHAHATYRFVIVDEEQELPRILVCAIIDFLRGSELMVRHSSDLVVQTKYAIGVYNTGTVCHPQGWINPRGEGPFQDPWTDYGFRASRVRTAPLVFMFDSLSSFMFRYRILQKYPGFPQAEHLYYPRDVSRRLGAVLKESNTAYPESMRTMTGLDVGWLHRA